MLRALLSGELNKTNNTTVVNTTVNTPQTPTNTTTDTTPTTTNLTPSQTTNEIGDVRDLQTKLKDLGYFKFDVDGLYNKRLVDALFAFQLEKKIVTGEDDPGAGYYGPVTKNTLVESYKSYEERREQIISLERERENARVTLNNSRLKKKQEFEATLKKIPTVKLRQVHPEIRTLQKILKQVNYLNHKDTAIFGDLTKNALAQYQLELKVIDSLSSPHAGVLGDKTREAIAIDLYNRWVVTDVESEKEINRIQGEIDALKKV
jgi:peptidoglycan hydrolase-like protein with peptidoglycan-binding domain